MMNKNLKSMVKTLVMGICSLSIIAGLSTNVYAFDPEEADTNCAHANVEQMFNQPIPCKQGGKMDTLITICTDCGGVIKTQDVMREDPHGKHTEQREDGIYCSACGEKIADNKQEPKKEEVKKEEPKQNPHVQAIKEKRQWLINNGINDRENNKYFQVFVNNELSNVKLDVNDKIDVDNSGLCKGEHRMVTYFQNHGQLEFVGQCLDCNEQRITMAEEVLPGMNVVGTKVAKAEAKVEEVKTIVKGLTEEEQQEITRNYKLADMKAAIDSLE